jgi:hypothetical protein
MLDISVNGKDKRIWVLSTKWIFRSWNWHFWGECVCARTNVGVMLPTVFAQTAHQTHKLEGPTNIIFQQDGMLWGSYRMWLFRVNVCVYDERLRSFLFFYPTWVKIIIFELCECHSVFPKSHFATTNKRKFQRLQQLWNEIAKLSVEYVLGYKWRSYKIMR